MKRQTLKVTRFKNLFLLTISIIVAVTIAEIYFRKDGTYSTYMEQYGGKYSSVFTPGEKNWYHIFLPRHIRTDDGSEFSYSFTANNEGLLDYDFKDKDSTTIRILILGDSYIQGIGAPNDSSCPKQLEKIMNASYAGKPKIEVWNCGIGGSDIFFEYMLLQNKLLPYKPDMVVVGINWTDIDDIIIRGGWKRFKADSTVAYNPAPWFEPLYGRSFLLRRIIHDVLHYNWLFFFPKEYEAAKQNSKKEIKDCLQKFHQLCQQQRIPFHVAFQPGPFEFKFENHSMEDLNNLMSYCDSTNIPYTNVKTYIESQLSDTTTILKLYWPRDKHFKAQGYYYYAKSLAGPVSNQIDSIMSLRLRKNKANL